jgi:hypothetical protein
MKIIDKFKDKINGILSDFVRMIIKGHIRQFFSKSGNPYIFFIFIHKFNFYRIYSKSLIIWTNIKIMIRYFQMHYKFS